jgi:hypothetical protein
LAGAETDVAERNHENGSWHEWHKVKRARRSKFHQWLTESVRHPGLLEHVASAIALMKAAGSRDEFKKMIDEPMSKYKEMPLIDDLEDGEGD